MQRRTFLSSLLGGLGLGWLAPKAKASFPDPFVPATVPYHFGPADFLGEMGILYHDRSSTVYRIDDGVVHAYVEGKKLCSFVCKGAEATVWTTRAQIRNSKKEVLWEVAEPRKETHLKLDKACMPAAILAAFAATFGDVVKAPTLDLVVFGFGVTEQWDFKYPVLSVLQRSVKSAEMTVTEGMQFIATSFTRNERASDPLE